MSKELEQEVFDAQVVEGDQVVVRATDTTRSNLSDAHKDFIASLRAMANFYEARPDLELPMWTRFDLFGLKPQDLQRVSLLFAPCEKAVLPDFFMLRRRFGKSIRLEANWSRETVCERVVVGTEEVDEEVVVSKGVETRMNTGQKVEWHCPKVLDRKQVGEGSNDT